MVTRIVLMLVLLGAFPPMVAQNREVTEPPVLQIDCDAGQDLARALRRVRDAPGARIDVIGTCVGSFVIETDRLRLQGALGGTTTLEAAPGEGTTTVLEVRGAEDVLISDLTIRGGSFGVVFRRSPGADIRLSTISDNVVGVYNQESVGTVLSQCELRDHAVGVDVRRHASVTIYRSDIRNSTVGVAVLRRSSLFMDESSISDSGEVGLDVGSLSDAELSNTELSDNGYVHVRINDRSYVKFRTNVTVGSPTDATSLAALLNGESTLLAGFSTIFGDFQLWSKSFLSLGFGQAFGSLNVEDLSQVLLRQITITGTVTCEHGGDVRCVDTATVEVPVDCPSATMTCAPPPATESTN